MEYQISWVTAYGDEAGQEVVNTILDARAQDGWEVHTHSAVLVVSTGQSEYVPQGHPLFAHFFVFRR